MRRNARTDQKLRRIARHVAHSEGFRAGQLSIAVVGKAAMARLHAESLRIPTPTDVLTFDLGTDRKRGWLEGEVVVCADVAREQIRGSHSRARAGDAAASVDSELALYVTHGILHLAGYDDRTPADFRRMHSRETELLRPLLGAYLPVT